MILNNRCYIIAEAGLNHNGSIEIAKKLIDIASVSGADAVKFQKRDIISLATNDVLNKEDKRFPNFGNTYREIREFLEFNLEDYKFLKHYTKEKKMDFIVTPFDIPSVEFLENVGLDAYKIASHSLTNLNLLEYVSQKKKHIILSTGMCVFEDIDLAVNIIKKNNCPLSLLHCVSSYPTKNEDSNLKLINILNERYNIPVGYSGHEIGFKPSILAVASGAKLIERHYTINKNMEGFDHKISLEPEELKEMIKEIRLVEKIIGDGKKFISETENITLNKYHVSMITSRNIKKGEKLDKSMITYKNPGNGISPKSEKLYLNKIFKEDVAEDILVNENMFR